MRNIKSFIRHELINILTVINILVIDGRLNSAKKERITDLIKLANLFIYYEDIFLGKKVNFINEIVNLREVLEMIAMIYEEQIQKKNIKIVLPKRDFFVKTDKQSIRESLEHIIKRLLVFVSKMQFQFDEKNKQLVIRFKEQKVKALSLTKEPLIQCLNKNKLNENEIAFQFALELLDRNRIKFKSMKEKLIITFI